MNPNVEPPPPQALAPPPQLQQTHRLSTSCDRHPEENFSGFCPSCLCERLAVLEPSSSSAAAASSSSSSSRKPPIAAAALKAIFKSSGGGATRPGFFPELRRTKSFSASKNEGFSGVFEPQRKSCDVRVRNRNTLWSLFYEDDERKPQAAVNGRCSEIVEERNLGSSSNTVQDPVLERKEKEDQTETDHEDDIEIIEDELLDVAVASGSLIEDKAKEIVEEECEVEELKPMKDHIDLDSQTKKASGRDFKEIAGSFWSAASVFSKKLQKWRQKQKLKKGRNRGGGSARLPVEKSIVRQYRETQSEIADYGFGRRSCDTDPRFSLDVGRRSFDATRMSFDATRMSFDATRMSFDDPRYSFDEPRTSWDGHLIGRTFPRMPPMVSVVEDDVPPVMRSDTQIPVDDPPPPAPPAAAAAMNSINESDESLPEGSAETRDYNSDSCSRRRKSLDGSNSIRKIAAAVVAEIDEMKYSVSNAKVSPATVDYKDSNSNNSLKDDYSDTFEISGFTDNASVIVNGEQKSSCKKSLSRRWSKGWNIWGFIHRTNVNKDEDEDTYGRANGVECSYSESWPELSRERNVDTRGGGRVRGFNPKVLRSNSSVSWRNSGSFFGGASKNSGEEPNVYQYHNNSKKKRDEFVLERKRSARFSPRTVLRLY